jgi:hypothetical protein
MLPSIIGLYSPSAGSGKSEVAKRLCGVHGYTLVKFADPLKAMARGLFEGMGISAGTIERMIEGDLKEQPIPGLKSATPRQVMQTLGTEWGREAIEEDLWVKTGVKKAQSIIDAGGRVVIDDMRFPNEWAYVYGMDNSMLVAVHRPGQPKGQSRYEGMLCDFRFDCVLVNDETLEVLHQAVDVMVAAAGQYR